MAAVTTAIEAKALSSAGTAMETEDDEYQSEWQFGEFARAIRAEIQAFALRLHSELGEDRLARVGLQVVDGTGGHYRIDARWITESELAALRAEYGLERNTAHWERVSYELLEWPYQNVRDFGNNTPLATWLHARSTTYDQRVGRNENECSRYELFNQLLVDECGDAMRDASETWQELSRTEDFAALALPYGGRTSDLQLYWWLKRGLSSEYRASYLSNWMRSLPGWASQGGA